MDGSDVKGACELLPLSWLEIGDEIPEDLRTTLGRAHASHMPGRALQANLLALRPTNG